MNELIERAALTFYLGTAERLGHDVGQMLAGIAQGPAAQLGSAVDDAWLFAIENEGRNDG